MNNEPGSPCDISKLNVNENKSFALISIFFGIHLINVALFDAKLKVGPRFLFPPCLRQTNCVAPKEKHSMLGTRKPGVDVTCATKRDVV